MAGACGADNAGNDLLASLTAGEDFTVPNPDLSGSEFKIPDGLDSKFGTTDKLTNNSLTTRTVGGDGTFDAIMASLSAHLKEEFRANRITGSQYTEAYSAAAAAALNGAVSFLLGRDNAYWQAVIAAEQAKKAAIETVAARVQLETAKAQLSLMLFQGKTAKAEYALAKMKLATEDQNYCQIKFTVDNILPLQKTLLAEQVEVQRSQTLDSRTDGQTIVGSVGSQKALWAQQILSYKRDSELKAAKIYSDAWITQKTIDEGLLAPGEFNNATVDRVFTVIRTNNGLL